jgi:regulatory protein YycI of two-component signal transduction system YycFG
MINGSMMIEILIIFLIGTIIGTIYFNDIILANRATHWEIVESYIEGDLKNDIMKIYLFSDAKYMQCI